jgi:hypothetical protein
MNLRRKKSHESALMNKKRFHSRRKSASELCYMRKNPVDAHNEEKFYYKFAQFPTTESTTIVVTYIKNGTI